MSWVPNSHVKPKDAECIEDTARKKIFLAWLRLWWGGLGWRKLEWPLIYGHTLPQLLWPTAARVLSEAEQSAGSNQQWPCRRVLDTHTRVLARAVWASPSLRAFSQVKLEITVPASLHDAQECDKWQWTLAFLSESEQFKCCQDLFFMENPWYRWWWSLQWWWPF